MDVQAAGDPVVDGTREQRWENSVPGTTKGPTSCFPAVEAEYGHPIEHWQQLLREHRAEHPDSRHVQRVARLESEYGMGHGHGNALAAGDSTHLSKTAHSTQE